MVTPQGMLILALDTSTKMGSVALCKETNGTLQILAERSSERQKSHSEFLNLAVEEVLHESRCSLSQIDVFATSEGPGSFTGLRVAGNIAKTFAFSFSRPMFIANSLVTLAKQGDFPEVSVCLLNAFKNMVFCALYEGQKQIIAPCALTLPELEQKILAYAHANALDQIECFGEGFSVYETLLSQDLLRVLKQTKGSPLYPEAKTLARLLVDNKNLGRTIEWNSFTPLYIRASAAEENKRNNS